MTIPMLADFALRLACGLAALLLLTPWRVVPPAFFRTHCQVILGLLVLAALDASRVGRRRAGLWRRSWPRRCSATSRRSPGGWGCRGSACPSRRWSSLACAGDLVAVSRSADPRLWALNAAGRLASAFLMGSTLTAMLLGHHYLTAPAMSIEPLKRFVRCMAWGLGLAGGPGGGRAGGSGRAGRRWSRRSSGDGLAALPRDPLGDGRRSARRSRRS